MVYFLLVIGAFFTLDRETSCSRENRPSSQYLERVYFKVMLLSNQSTYTATPNRVERWRAGKSCDESRVIQGRYIQMSMGDYAIITVFSCNMGNPAMIAG